MYFVWMVIDGYYSFGIVYVVKSVHVFLRFVRGIFMVVYVCWICVRFVWFVINLLVIILLIVWLLISRWIVMG